MHWKSKSDSSCPEAMKTVSGDSLIFVDPAAFLPLSNIQGLKIDFRQRLTDREVRL